MGSVEMLTFDLYRLLIHIPFSTGPSNYFITRHTHVQQGKNQCHSVCVSVCLCVCVSVGKKYLKTVAKVFKDIILNENNQQNHIGTFPYLIQVKAVLFTIISGTSYYQFFWLHYFEIEHGGYSQQLTYTKIQEYVDSIWQHTKRHVGYVFHEYTLVHIYIWVTIFGSPETACDHTASNQDIVPYTL